MSVTREQPPPPQHQQPGPSSPGRSHHHKAQPQFPSQNVKDAYARGTYIQAYKQPYDRQVYDPHQAPTRASLKAWWRQFTSTQRMKHHRQEEEKEKREKEKEKDGAGGRVFGVTLRESLTTASVQVSTADKDRGMYVWGVIPVVVAKCGLYLKENATEIEGIFRISGSNKRMRDLQSIFETPPKYGKSLDWEDQQYTPHDVASVFRRYLTQIPESVIPPEQYNNFRDVLATKPVDRDKAVAAFKRLIRTMPDVNQYLLLYVLDLLSVFARKSDKNLMDAGNLSVIFRPGIIRHPAHELTPSEHQLSQEVLQFLIAHQNWFMDVPRLQAPPRGSTVPPSRSAPAGSPLSGGGPSSAIAPGAMEARSSMGSDYLMVIPSTDEEGGWKLVDRSASALGGTSVTRRRTTSAAPSPTTSSAGGAAAASGSGSGQQQNSGVGEMGELSPVLESGPDVLLGEGAATVGRSRTLPSERRVRMTDETAANTDANAMVQLPLAGAGAGVASALAMSTSDSGSASGSERRRMNVLRKSKRRSTGRGGGGET